MPFEGSQATGYPIDLPANPQDVQLKAASLRNAALQQQLSRQQIQGAQMENQQRQREMDQTQALNDAYRGSLTVGPNGAPDIDQGKLTQALGVSGHGAAIPGVIESVNKFRKSSADLSEAQGKVAALEGDAAGSMSSAVRQAKYDPNLFVALAQHAVDAKHVDAATIAPLINQVQQAMQQDPTGEAARKIVQQVTDQLIAASPKQRELDNATATAGSHQQDANTRAQKQANEAPGQVADATQKQVTALAPQLESEFARGGLPAVQAALDALPHGVAKRFQGAQKAGDFTAAALTPEQSTQAGQTALRDKNTADNQAATRQQEQQRISVERQRLGLSQQEYQQKYGDVVGNMSPGNRAIAEKVATGDYDPAQLRGLPGKEQILAGAFAMARDKGVEWTPQIYATKKSFTDPNGIGAKNLATISRIVGHIGRFEGNSQNMGFAPAYGSGMNVTGGQAALNEDAHAISGELEKLVSGGVGSVEQTRQWQKSLHSPSADARQKGVDEISQLVGSQYEGMNQTYKSAVGSDLPIAKYVTPAGQAWMKSKGINVAGAAAPPLPSKLGTGDVGRPFVNKAGKTIKVTAVNPADPTQFRFDEVK